MQNETMEQPVPEINKVANETEAPVKVQDKIQVLIGALTLFAFAGSLGIAFNAFIFAMRYGESFI
ncbi:MAG: hypothetical protein ABIE68_01410 [bacterium]